MSKKLSEAIKDKHQWQTKYFDLVSQYQSLKDLYEHQQLLIYTLLQSIQNNKK